MDAKKHLYLVLICICSYSFSIYGNFLFDDGEAIVKNKDVLPGSSLHDVFTNDFWGTPIYSNASHKSYRPLTILTYRLNIILSGSTLDPVGFHITNIILYALLCILTMSFYAMILRSDAAYLGSDVPFLSALLFSLHPVHVESVAGLVGRADILCSILSLIALLIYDRVIVNNSIILLFVTLLIIIAAILCKETGIMTLPLCWTFDMLTLIRRGGFHSKNARPFFKRSIFLIISSIIIMYCRLAIMDFQSPVFTANDNPTAHSNSVFVKVITYNYIYLLNFVILIWPQWLCFDWSMGCIPLIESIDDGRFILVPLFWICFLYAAYALVQDLMTNRNRFCALISFCCCIFPFIPSMNLFVGVGFVIAERTLLMPSIGYCFLIAIGLKKLETLRFLYKKHLRNMYYIVCMIFFLRTIQRNLDWHSERNLFMSALDVCPLNAKVHYNIAKIAADNSDKVLAMQEYRKAIDLNPKYEQAMNNLANLLREDNRFIEAEKYLREALKIRPNFAAAWMNLAIVLTNINSTEEAERCYYEAISHRSKYPDCYYNLGNLYLDLQRFEEALSAWKQAVSYRPTHVAAWSNVLVLLDSQLRYKEVLELGNIALNSNPSSAAIHFNIANTLGKIQDFQKAELHFLEAINLNPQSAIYYSNLGVLYHHWGKTKKAINMYQKAITIDSRLKSANINLQKLLKTHGTARHTDKASK